MSVQQLGRLYCNDGVGLFATATARLKLQHLQTMRLIMQHKPIERSTDMVILMTKKSQIQAWLNCLYTEKRYGQHTVSKHVHAGRHPKVLFCQSIVLPKYHVAKVLVWQHIILPKHCFAKI